ncbi:MAG: response regulator [Faecalibacterium sp.]
MYKLLIADDERLERTALAQIVEAQFGGVFEVQEAENGRVALELSHTFRPDIIMMDIKMPAMNGIDAAREIVQRYPDTKIIMLTGFAYFHYAKECVNIGAMDFLVKPTTNDMVVEVLARAIQAVDTQRLAQQSVQAEKEKLKLADHYIENEFLSELFFGGADPEIAAQRMDDLGVLGMHYTVAIFFPEIGYGKDGLGASVKRYCREIANAQSEEIRVLLCEHYGRICMLLCASEVKPQAWQSHWLESFLRNITLQQKCIAGIGVSQTSADHNALPQLVQQAYKAYQKNNAIQFYQPQRSTQSYVSQYALEQKLCTLLRQHEYTELMAQLHPTMNDIFENSAEPLDEITELLILLNRAAAESIVVEPTVGIYRKIDRLEDAARVKNFSMRFVQTIIDRMIHKETEDASDWSKKAADIIQKNYTKDLTMEDVAHQVGFSTYYFSRLFKQTFQMSFVDYLTKLRLEKAKALLRQSNASVKEVCFQVGYSEPNYFARVFKKETGRTPTEYQKNINVLN